MLMRNLVDTPRALGARADKVANGLGLFSLALAAAELGTPGRLGRWLGMRGANTLLRSYGLREAAAGAGILASNRKGMWVWSRVAGDAVDIGTLLLALRTSRRKGNVALAFASVAAITALDVICARTLSREE